MKRFLFSLFIFLALPVVAQTVTLDPTFNTGTGPNNVVITTAILPDGKILIAGSFLMVDGQIRLSIARLNADGSVDATFDTFEPYQNAFTLDFFDNGNFVLGGLFTALAGNLACLGSNGGQVATVAPIGFNGTVLTTKVQPDQKVIVGGYFDTFDGNTANRIIRLTSNLAVDATFNTGTGFDYGVHSVCIQPDGKIIVGGQFTGYNGVMTNRIARLNSDGSLDNTFGAFTGFDAGVALITLQPDGKIIVAGEFTSYNGVARKSILRLNADGTLDTSFDPGSGFDLNVTDVVIEPGGKILVGGDFTSFNGVSRNRIARLNSDGSLDNTFDPGTGFDALVWSLSQQADGKIIVGGNFTSYNGTPKNYLVRLDASASELTELHDNGLEVFPNPTSGQFTINVQDVDSDTEYRIVDQLGKVVTSDKLPGFQTLIDLDLPAGFYFLEAAGEVIKFEVLR